MKKRIFITGISSTMMQKFISFIDFSKYEIIGLTRSPKLKLKNTTLITGDLSNISRLSQHIESCYMIIHVAAISNTFNETEYYQINLEGTKQLVEIAKIHNVKRFIYISSYTVGIKSGTYSLTKLLAEKYIQENLSNWIIFRPSEIYGSTKNEGIEKLLIDVIDKHIVLCPLSVPSKFVPIHIDDAIQKMYNYIFNKKHINNKIIVIKGSKAYSFLEIIKLTKAISGSKAKIIFIPKIIMFIIQKITKTLPFYIGIIPDQIVRLYGIKHHDNYENNFEDNSTSLEVYIKQLIESN